MKQTFKKIEKATKAAGNYAYANRRVVNYTGVDGRVYKTEAADARQLKMRAKVIRNGIVNDRVSAADIIRIEAFLANGCIPDKAKKVTELRRQEVVSEYELSQDPRTNRWTGDESRIFSILCAKYPAASRFKSFKDLKYVEKYYDPRNGAVKTSL